MSGDKRQALPPGRLRRLSLSHLEHPRHTSIGLKRKRSLDHDWLHNAKTLSRSHLTKALLQRIHHDLQKAHVDPRQYTFERFRRFLPDESHNDQQLSIFRRWIDEPMLVTNEELACIIGFKFSDHSSPRLISSSACYFRSYEMRASELLAIMARMESNGIRVEKLDHWKYALANKACANNTKTTLRYVGLVSAPKNPFIRFREDSNWNCTSKLSAFFRCFSSLVEQFHPEIHRRSRVFLISDSVLHCYSDIPGRLWSSAMLMRGSLSPSS